MYKSSGETLGDVVKRYPGDFDRLRRLSLIEEAAKRLK
jgi:hypothetical protein